ncbi:RcpC/CpaB family pilus assembly protein [Geodermatophilus amargosae]|uniref:RcpC/CpaB family pilus assembly protein n=1 Tax=Geodermatophilus amargosae TaxID=1296565 RepID=UPI0034DECB47
MRRRLIAALAALVLAVLGAVVLVDYVRSADARAQAGEELVTVLVVDAQVPAGTDAAAVAGVVSEVQVPSRLAAPGSMADLGVVSGKVTTAPLLPGEQVRAERFVDPASLTEPGTVPPGMVEVTVALDAQRAAGGVLAAGDKVGVQLTSQLPEVDGLAAYTVFRVLHDVLVTRITSVDETAANGGHLVTLAVSRADAEAVVIGSTAQALYLSLEDAASSGDTTLTTTGDDK